MEFEKLFYHLKLDELCHSHNILLLLCVSEDFNWFSFPILDSITCKSKERQKHGSHFPLFIITTNSRRQLFPNSFSVFLWDGIFLFKTHQNVGCPVLKESLLQAEWSFGWSGDRFSPGISSYTLHKKA